MKISIGYKINRLIAIIVISITVILMGISLIVVNRFTGSSAETMMTDKVEMQTVILNNKLRSVENAVHSIYEVSRYAEKDYQTIKEEDVETYLDLFRNMAINIAKDVDGGVAVYFRLSPEMAGDGKQGFLYLKESRNGGFISSENTDILAYDPDDVEHVGWYYIPIKAKKGTWLPPYYNANLGFNMISYVMPIFDKDMPVGVVGMDINFNNMISVAEDVNIFESNGANLLDIDSHAIYYDKMDIPEKVLQKEMFFRLTEDKSEKMLSFSYDAEEYKMHYATLINGMKYILYAKTADIYEVGRRLIIYGILVFMLIFVLTLMIAIRLSNRIVGPITNINKATREYAKGNWDVELSCDTGDELEELTDSILDMAQNTKDNIRNLRDAMIVAEEASKAKTTFLSNVSHDIRTPMNAIVTYSQLAVSQNDLTEKTRSYLGHILQASNHLLSLINSVLDMSRIESGKSQINLLPCNVKELISELGAMVYANAKEKNQTITIDTSGIVNENIMCDSLRFNQVMINLLGNAVKYTGENGKVYVNASETPGNVPGESVYHFSVKDTGIGMDEEFLGRIFSPFEREISSTVNEIQGTGLGLAISKTLVEMMGGSISVKSKKGEGTEFSVEVPFTHGDNLDNTEVFENAPTDSAPEIDLSALKVLVAEDNKVNRLIVKELLGETVALLDFAVNGREAVDMLKEKGGGYYDIVLMDVQMPEMNGYEATRAIRMSEDEKIKSIPVIAMTANAFEEDKKEAMEAGMNTHLAKPIDVPALIRAIGELVK